MVASSVHRKSRKETSETYGLLPLHYCRQVKEVDQEVHRLLVWIVFLAVPSAIWLIKPIRRYIPLVVLQIGLGFCLGPVVLGGIWPQAFVYLFPNDVVTFISTVGFVAVIAFVYATGLHIHLAESRGHIVIVSFSSTFIPLLIGIPVARTLGHFFPKLVGPSGNILTFTLSISIAVSVSALPVLAALLHEMNEIDKENGKFVLGVAVFHDALLWISLAILLVLVRNLSPERRQTPSALVTFILSSAYAVIVLFGLKYLLEKLVASRWWEKLPDNLKLSFQGLLFLSSAVITQVIGIHYLIGVVLAGVAWPYHNRKPILKRMESFVQAILLPMFFAAAGIKTKFTVNAPEVWVTFVVMTFTAYIGQFFGTAVILKILGYQWLDSLDRSVLLTCKGIAELVVLGLMHSVGIISDECFAGMVLMALLTTGLTRGLTEIIRRLEARVASADT